MKYREAIHRIQKNVQDPTPTSDLLIEYKEDVADVFVDAFGRSHAPRKTQCWNVGELNNTWNAGEQSDTVENFNNSTLINNMNLITFTVNSGKAVLSGPDESGKIIVTNLNQISSLSFDIEASSETNGQSSFATVKVLTGDGSSTLYSESFNVVEGDAEITKQFDMSINEKCIYIEVSVSNSSQFLAKTAINNFTMAQDFHKLILPNEVFFPLHINFNDSEGKKLVSEEILGEEYANWRPNTYSTEENTGDITEPLGNIESYFITEENVLYDYKIGFVIENNKDGNFVIKYKPTFNGIIEVYYAYIPDITYDNIDDNKQVPLNRFFEYMIVSGCSVKRLYRKLMDKELNEVMLEAIKLNIRQHKSVYDDLLNRFAGWMTNEKTSTEFVRPFNILDYSQEISGYTT